MVNLVNEPLKTVQVNVPSCKDPKVKTESSTKENSDKPKTMKILTESVQR